MGQIARVRHFGRGKYGVQVQAPDGRWVTAQFRGHLKAAIKTAQEFEAGTRTLLTEWGK